MTQQAMKESEVATTEKYIMTTAKEPTDNDFERMMHMITGYWVTQIAGAVASYSIADHLAKGPASAEEISKMAGIDSIAAFRLLRACASLGLVTFDGLTFTANLPELERLEIVLARASRSKTKPCDVLAELIHDTLAPPSSIGT